MYTIKSWIRSPSLRSFVIADIATPILGVAFIYYFGQLIDFRRQLLIDFETNQKSKGLFSLKSQTKYEYCEFGTTFKILRVRQEFSVIHLIYDVYSNITLKYRFCSIT